MRSKGRSDKEKRNKDESRRRHSRPSINSRGSTDSSPSSTSVDRRHKNRTRSSTSDLWNTFEPRPMLAHGPMMPNTGPFTGHFIHPDFFPHHPDYQYFKQVPKEHNCNHCVRPNQVPIIQGPMADYEMFDCLGHMKQGHHHPYIADERLLYEGMMPQNLDRNHSDSYHSDFRDYFQRHQASSFESMPDMRYAIRREAEHSLPPCLNHASYPGYVVPPSHIPGPMKWFDHRHPPHQEHHPQSHHPQPHHPTYHHQQSHIYPQQHYPQYLPMANFYHDEFGLYDVPSYLQHPPSQSHSRGHHPYRLSDPLDFHGEARKHSKKKRSPSPERQRKYRSRSPKEGKQDKVKVETIPVKYKEKRNLPLKLQKQLTQKSNLVQRQNTNLSIMMASPLYNGPPPRRVFAYADPQMHGLTPHPSTEGSYNNYGQPEWLRYDSFGESPEIRANKRPSFDFTEEFSPMHTSPEYDRDRRELNRQKTFNKMKKQKTPFNEVADSKSIEKS
jgi:hypothetical protein